ncbi:MAG: hypothetical protein ACREFS_13225, partial [Acetobacteraceae bacterium]
PFSGLIFVRFVSLYDLLERECWRSPGIADGWHPEVGGPGAAVAFNAPVEAGEFSFSGFQADLKALNFAEPAVHPCFGDALAQVVDDLGEAGPLLRRHAEHRASQGRQMSPPSG